MIIYFSATGNTKHCAERIAQKTANKLLSINNLMKNGISEINCENDSQLGIFLPTYDWGIPWAVADYLKSVKFKNLPNDAYIYSIHTCGNMSGASAVRMKNLLTEKGLHHNAAFSVVTTSSEYLFGKKISEKEQARIMSEADHMLDNIIEDINKRNSVVRMQKTVPGFVEKLASKLALPNQKKVSKFHVSEDCIGCGGCSERCPQNIIEMKDNKPVWTTDKCLCCYSCITYCPKLAISCRK